MSQSQMSNKTASVFMTMMMMMMMMYALHVLFASFVYGSIVKQQLLPEM